MLIFINENVCNELVYNRLAYQYRLISNQYDCNANEQTATLFNLSSIINSGIRLPALIPPLYFLNQQIELDNEKTFDMAYANYIMQNDAAFTDLFKIINTIYNGGTAIILYSDNEYTNIITESLLKFIQQRYGLNPIYIMNSIDDWDCITQDTRFNLLGVFNLDTDKERFVKITTDFNELTRINQEQGDYNGYC